MKNVINLLRIALYAVVIAFVLTTSVFLFNILSNSRVESNKVFAQNMGKAINAEVLDYNGQIVLGSTINSLITQYGEQVAFRIQTKNNPLGFCFFGEKTSKDSLQYIPLQSKYSANAIKDVDGNFVGMKFTEFGTGSLSLSDIKNQKENLCVYKEAPLFFEKELQASKSLEKSKIELLNADLDFVKAGNQMTVTEMNRVLNDEPLDSHSAALDSLKMQYQDILSQQKNVLKELAKLKDIKGVQ